MIIVRQGKCNSYRLVLSVNSIVVVNTFTLLKRRNTENNVLPNGKMAYSGHYQSCPAAAVLEVQNVSQWLARHSSGTACSNVRCCCCSSCCGPEVPAKVAPRTRMSTRVTRLKTSRRKRRIALALHHASYIQKTIPERADWRDPLRRACRTFDPKG